MVLPFARDSVWVTGRSGLLLGRLVVSIIQAGEPDGPYLSRLDIKVRFE